MKPAKQKEYSRVKLKQRGPVVSTASKKQSIVPYKKEVQKHPVQKQESFGPSNDMYQHLDQVPYTSNQELQPSQTQSGIGSFYQQTNIDSKSISPLIVSSRQEFSPPKKALNDLTFDRDSFTTPSKSFANPSHLQEYSDSYKMQSSSFDNQSSISKSNKGEYESALLFSTAKQAMIIQDELSEVKPLVASFSQTVNEEVKRQLFKDDEVVESKQKDAEIKASLNYQIEKESGYQNKKTRNIIGSMTEQDIKRAITPDINQRNYSIMSGDANQNTRRYSIFSGDAARDEEEGKSLMKSKSELIYFSQRGNSSRSKRSTLSKANQKEKKLSIHYFLGTQKQEEVKERQKHANILNNILDHLASSVHNSSKIMSNLKTIFFENSIFIEGGTMGSTVQPVNQNMMTLYLFHQFLKQYNLVFDAFQSHTYETIFVAVSYQNQKKLDFKLFGTVLAKIALKLYGNIDPVEALLKLINNYLFPVANSQQESLDVTQQTTHTIAAEANQDQSDNQFEKYRLEFENSGLVKVMMCRKQSNLEKVFDSYAKASKRGVKIIALRQFKWMLRDLQIIPHITTEYKCSQLFKYLDSSKDTSLSFPEEILTLKTFPLCLYIIFSLILNDNEGDEQEHLKNKVNFIVKWVREHAKNKLASSHATKEDKRLKYTNEKLASSKKQL